MSSFVALIMGYSQSAAMFISYTQATCGILTNWFIQLMHDADCKSVMLISSLLVPFPPPHPHPSIHLQVNKITFAIHLPMKAKCHMKPVSYTFAFRQIKFVFILSLLLLSPVGTGLQKAFSSMELNSQVSLHTRLLHYLVFSQAPNEAALEKLQI